VILDETETDNSPVGHALDSIPEVEEPSHEPTGHQKEEEV